MHVMICDDDAAVRFVSSRWLTSILGCVVSESGDGVEALNALGDQHVDLLLLDLALPRMSGVEVVEAIRESGTLPDLPIVVLSNERRVDVIRQVISLGVSDYLLKPLKATVVRERLGPLLARARRNRFLGPGEARTFGPEAPALFVDGDANFRHTFLSVAQTFGPVVAAESGADAVAAFRAAPTGLVFVGQRLGIVGLEPMSRRMRDASATPPMFVGLGTFDVAVAKAAGLAAVIERSYQPDAIARSLQPFVEHAGPMSELQQLTPGLEQCLSTAVPQVLGMMADLAVVQIESPLAPPSEGLLATTTADVAGFSVVVDILMTSEMAAAVCARMLADGSTDFDAETLHSTMSEIANMVTGRLDAFIKSRGSTCRCTLPQARAIVAADLAVSTAPGEGFTHGYALGSLPGIVVVRATAIRQPA